jgi:hypothetical protein
MKKAFALIAVLSLGFGAKIFFAQTEAASAAPEVNIIDITHVIYPLPLPNGGGPITFTYKVTNPGEVSLSDVTVVDDACSDMSGELGDTNGNHLLDPGEEWIYTCAAMVVKTTTHTATVTAYANGLKAVDAETATVDVPALGATPSPTFPNDGPNPNTPTLPNNGTNPNSLNITVLIWEILGGILVVLIIIYFVITRKK